MKAHIGGNQVIGFKSCKASRGAGKLGLRVAGRVEGTD
jgi:hypothetical protein